jgi:hypothetical protein
MIEGIPVENLMEMLGWETLFEGGLETHKAGRYSPVLRGVFGGRLDLCDGADPIP